MRRSILCLVALAALAGSAAAEAPNLALKGLDPTLLTAGTEAPGSEALAVEYQGFTYHFQSAENLARFEAEPERFAFQGRGQCAVMPQARAHGDLYAVHEGRIYGFGSTGCREKFLAEPAKFVGNSGSEDPSSTD